MSLFDTLPTNMKTDFSDFFRFHNSEANFLNNLKDNILYIRTDYFPVQADLLQQLYDLANSSSGSVYLQCLVDYLSI